MSHFFGMLICLHLGVNNRYGDHAARALTEMARSCQSSVGSTTIASLLVAILLRSSVVAALAAALAAKSIFIRWDSTLRCSRADVVAAMATWCRRRGFASVAGGWGRRSEGRISRLDPE